MRCNGITKAGTRCKRFTKNNERCCNQHLSSEETEKTSETVDISEHICIDTEKKEKVCTSKNESESSNTDCSICLEKNNSTSIRCEVCENLTHEECLAGMWKMECPLCRTDISKILKEKASKETIRRIEENIERKRQEEIEEDREIARTYQESFRIINLGTLSLPPGSISSRGVPDANSLRLIMELLHTLSLGNS